MRRGTTARGTCQGFAVGEPGSRTHPQVPPTEEVTLVEPLWGAYTLKQRSGWCMFCVNVQGVYEYIVHGNELRTISLRERVGNVWGFRPSHSPLNGYCSVIQQNRCHALCKEDKMVQEAARGRNQVALAPPYL
jgi:hypothetical protein